MRGSAAAGAGGLAARSWGIESDGSRLWGATGSHNDPAPQEPSFSDEEIRKLAELRRQSQAKAQSSNLLQVGSQRAACEGRAPGLAAAAAARPVHLPLSRC